MRILIFSHNESKKFKPIVQFLEKQALAKVDVFNDIEEAEYCADIRTYDYIFVEYIESLRKTYMGFLKIAQNKVIRPNITVFGNEISEAGKDIFNLYNVERFLENEKDVIKDLETLLKSEISHEIEGNNIRIDLKEKKAWLKKRDEEIEIVFKKKIDFYVFVYFVRHYKETININAILDATCTEPELTKDSIIEASISSIRKTFKSLIDKNPIKAFKKVGYEFSV